MTLGRSARYSRGMPNARAGLQELVGEGAQLSRASVPYAAATFIGMATHVGLLALFAACRVEPMVWFNAASIAVFIVVWRLVVAGHVRAALLLAGWEMLVHQVLAVWCCGEAPGFQYYLFTLVPLVQILPGTRRALRNLGSLLPVVAYVILAFVAPRAPEHPLPAGLARGLGVANIVISFAVSFLFIHFYRRGAEAAEARLAGLAAKSERLLHGILPPVIVDRLRDGAGVVADRFESATVLFADLAGFTPLAQRKSAEQVVELLDEVFAALDALVERHGLEKIKTIGDAYMVAAGVPSPRSDHVAAMAAFALEARRTIAELSARLDEPLEARIGIHTGPLVAGVIGRSKFAYDLWGDVVNTAARMESHGETGRIHVTSAVAEALSGRGYSLDARGSIEVKGKGPMSTYWLEPAASARP